MRILSPRVVVPTLCLSLAVAACGDSGSSESDDDGGGSGGDSGDSGGQSGGDGDSSSGGSGASGGSSSGGTSSGGTSSGGMGGASGGASSGGMGGTGSGGTGSGGAGSGGMGSGGSESSKPYTINLNVDELDGTGTITVKGNPCAESCSYEDQEGAVTITAAPGPYSQVVWEGTDCTGNSCEVNAPEGDGPLNVSASFVLKHNVIFVTSTTQAAGAIGSLAAADAHCASLAETAGFHHEGWIAVLGTEAACPGESEGNCSPKDRLNGARGWLNVGLEPTFDQFQQWIDEEMWHTIRYDETGKEDLVSSVITGVDVNFEPYAGYTCGDYSSTDGDVSWGRGVDVTDGGFYKSRNGDCGYNKNRYYCMSTDYDTPLAQPVATGRLAFVSRENWTPGGGLADADLHCQKDACDAGLTGSANCEENLGTEKTFKAFLETSTVTAPSRFSASGDDYVRIDGLPFMPASDLSKAALDIAPRSALRIQADGSTFDGNYVWTGVGTTDRCGDWELNTGNGREGVPEYVNPYWISLGPFACSNGLRLYCFEE